VHVCREWGRGGLLDVVGSREWGREWGREWDREQKGGVE
jgi:hypothetical protein